MISVIIPTKNRAALLKATLDSVRGQLFEDWECIVVDDHSDDGTEHLVQCYSASDCRFIFTRLDQNSSGANAARNLGWRTATGELLVFLDSDDLLAAHCLEQRVVAMKENPALDFAVWPTLLFESIPGDAKLLWNVETSEDDLDRFLGLDIPWQTAGVIWRRAALEKVGWWKEGLPSWQDWEFHLRALALRLCYRRFAGPDNYWRKPRADSLWHCSRGPEHLASQMRLVQAAHRRLSENNLINEKRRRLLAGLYFWLARVWFASRRNRLQAVKVWRRACQEQLVPMRQFLDGCRWFSRLTRGRENNLRVVFPRWPKEYLIESSPTFHKVGYAAPARTAGDAD